MRDTLILPNALEYLAHVVLRHYSGVCNEKKQREGAAHSNTLSFKALAYKNGGLKSGSLIRSSRSSLRSSCTSSRFRFGPT